MTGSLCWCGPARLVTRRVKRSRPGIAQQSDALVVGLIRLVFTPLGCLHEIIDVKVIISPHPVVNFCIHKPHCYYSPLNGKIINGLFSAFVIAIARRAPKSKMNLETNRRRNSMLKDRITIRRKILFEMVDKKGAVQENPSYLRLRLISIPGNDPLARF